MAKTFAQLTAACQDRLGRDDSDTQTMIEDALNYVATQRLYLDFDMRPYRTRNYLYTAADSEKVSLSGLTGFDGVCFQGLAVESSHTCYTTGTVTCDEDTAVTGSGTTWNTQWIGFIGFGATDPSDITTWYQISSVDSTTGLTLGENGPSASGETYVIKWIEYWNEVCPMFQGEHYDRSGARPGYFDIVYESTVPYLYLRPIPDAVYALQIWWKEKETALTTGATTCFKFSTVYPGGDRLLITGAVLEVAQTLDLEKLEQKWKSRWFSEACAFTLWQDKLRGREALPLNSPYAWPESGSSGY